MDECYIRMTKLFRLLLIPALIHDVLPMYHYASIHGVLLFMVYSPHHLDQLPGQQRGPISSDK